MNNLPPGPPEPRDRTGPQPRIYPLPQPDDDPRFTMGLLIDLVDVLVAHGYPKPTSGGDLVELQQAIFRFLYDTAGEG